LPILVVACRLDEVDGGLYREKLGFGKSSAPSIQHSRLKLSRGPPRRGSSSPRCDGGLVLAKWGRVARIPQRRPSRPSRRARDGAVPGRVGHSRDAACSPRRGGTATQPVSECTGYDDGDDVGRSARSQPSQSRPCLENADCVSTGLRDAILVDKGDVHV